MSLFDLFRKGTPDAQGPLPLQPANDLERHLSAFVSGAAPIDPFLQELVKSQVAVLFHGKPTASGPPSPLKPLVLTSSKGFPAMPIFTTLDRSGPTQRQHPEYACGLLVAFPWVLQATPPNLGLVVNPGWSATIEQTPEGLVAFRSSLALDKT